MESKKRGGRDKLRGISNLKIPVVVAQDRSVAPSIGFTQNKTIELGQHYYEHSSPTSTYIDSLPKAKEYAPDKDSATIENQRMWWR